MCKFVFSGFWVLFFGLFSISSAFSVPGALGQKTNRPSTSVPYGLKGDLLGETIQEFRARHDRTINTPPDAVIAQTKHLPQCTNDPVDLSKYETLPIDVDASGESDEEQRAGVVKCIISLSAADGIGFDDPGSTIAGIGSFPIFYFFRGHLYKIDTGVARNDYQQLRKAFIEKYGMPLKAQTIKYQNAFGATFYGERLFWHNSSSSISIGEMDDDDNNTRVLFLDDSISKQVAATGAVKDRTKDM